MLITREHACLMGKIAFMGLWQGRFTESEEIFQALHAAEPERIGPVLGLGMTYAHKGDFEAARKVFEEKAMVIAPKDDHVLAWYGLILCRNGFANEAKPYLNTVLENGTDQAAKDMAQNLLKEIGQ